LSGNSRVVDSLLSDGSQALGDQLRNIPSDCGILDLSSHVVSSPKPGITYGTLLGLNYMLRSLCLDLKEPVLVVLTRVLLLSVPSLSLCEHLLRLIVPILVELHLLLDKSSVLPVPLPHHGFVVLLSPVERVAAAMEASVMMAPVPSAPLGMPFGFVLPLAFLGRPLGLVLSLFQGLQSRVVLRVPNELLVGHDFLRFAQVINVVHHGHRPLRLLRSLGSVP
jgi:hypothetical protein